MSDDRVTSNPERLGPAPVMRSLPIERRVYSVKRVVARGADLGNSLSKVVGDALDHGGAGVSSLQVQELSDSMRLMGGHTLEDMLREVLSGLVKQVQQAGAPLPLLRSEAVTLRISVALETPAVDDRSEAMGLATRREAALSYGVQDGGHRFLMVTEARDVPVYIDPDESKPNPSV